MSIIFHIFVVLITYTMLPKESINAPEVSESPLHSVGYKPLVGGASYFTTMKMIEDLGFLHPTVNNKYGRHYAIYECSYCGEPFKAMIPHVKNGHTKSCGCATAKIRSEKRIIHGLTKHPLYSTWHSMINRCCNPHHPSYKDYGERGISVCLEWIESVTVFYNWAISNGYNQGLVLDRENNDGNYTPLNCRWINTNISAENKRLLGTRNKSGYRGVMFRKKKNLKRPWLSRINHNYIEYKLGYYATAQQAAQAYNNFVIKNKTNHPLNKI